MKNLIIEETQDTPKIILDKVNGIFEVSGRSLPENAVSFFAPILKWLEEYATAPNQTTNFEFKLDYFNSASAKKIVEIISALEKLAEKKYPTVITWYYSLDDELIKNRGMEMSEMSEIPFEVRSY